MPPLTRFAAALVLAGLVLVPAPAAPALEHAATQSFEDAAPWSGITPAGCPAVGRAANNTAHSGSYVLASSCPAVTINFAAPQAYVTLWAKTDTGGGISIASSADSTPVRATGTKDQWVALTLPVTQDPTISQVIVSTDNPTGRVFIDDLTVSTAAEPDTAITSGTPAALTNQTTAAFGFDAGVTGATFSCALDGAAAAPCTSGTALGPLGEGDHTFSVAATDAFGHADATPAQYAWRVDTTPARTRISAGPSGSTTARAAQVSFSSAADDVGGFECSLDDQPFSACRSPQSYSDLPPGRRTVRVRATDTAGNVEAAPASLTWTVESQSTKDAGGTPSGSSAIEPACSASANPGQPDRDRDGLLDRCQQLPSGTLPVVAGVQAKVRVTDGEVWVRLAGGAGARAAASGAAGGTRGDGWVPLKGAAVIPMQSEVDARDGTLELQSARTAGNRPKLQTARFAAGIFQIRQARAAQARRARRAAPVDLHLRTPPGAATACAGAPGSKVVRTLSASATGHYRVWGAVSTGIVNGRASWTVSDRCDGTFTAVSRGVVAVHNLRADRTTRLRAGGKNLVAAPLFVSLKGGA